MQLRPLPQKRHVRFMSPFRVLQQAANGGLLHDPIVGGVRKKCTEPETVVGFHQGAEAFRNFRQLNAQTVQAA